MVEPATDQFMSEEEAIAAGHAPHCDGWLGRHRETARREGRYWYPACEMGCAVSVAGFADSQGSARAMAARSAHILELGGVEVFCQGECLER